MHKIVCLDFSSHLGWDRFPEEMPIQVMTSYELQVTAICEISCSPSCCQGLMKTKMAHRLYDVLEFLFFIFFTRDEALKVP